MQTLRITMKRKGLFWEVKINGSLLCHTTDLKKAFDFVTMSHDREEMRKRGEAL